MNMEAQIDAANLDLDGLQSRRPSLGSADGHH
jgi:hypothetical protein